VSLIPIEGQPGLFRAPNGRIINIRSFTPFEISERFEGIRWSHTCNLVYILEGWRFTCGEWPKDPVSIQQQVVLRESSMNIASASLSSILTAVMRPDSFRDMKREDLRKLLVDHHSNIEAVFQERPVEGAGLRIHLYGLRYTGHP
jgi:hypothetical protein